MIIAASHASAKLGWPGISYCSSTTAAVAAAYTLILPTYVEPAAASTSAVGTRGKLQLVLVGTPCSRARGGPDLLEASEITGGWVVDCGLWTVDGLEDVYDAHRMCENLDNGRGEMSMVIQVIQQVQ